MTDQRLGFIEPGYETLEKISEILGKARDSLGDVSKCCELSLYEHVSDDIKGQFDEIDKVVGDAYNVLDIASCMILRNAVSTNRKESREGEG